MSADGQEGPGSKPTLIEWMVAASTLLLYTVSCAEVWWHPAAASGCYQMPGLLPSWPTVFQITQALFFPIPNPALTKTLSKMLSSPQAMSLCVSPTSLTQVANQVACTCLAGLDPHSAIFGSSVHLLSGAPAHPAGPHGHASASC